MRPIDLQKVRTVSCLTGENLNRQNGHLRDPQENIHIQRTWMYAKDNAIEAVKEQKPTGKVSQILPYDNALSLPLGEGVWATKPKSDQTAFFRHIRSDITVQKNAIITRK
jgi:hypothetical protein